MATQATAEVKLQFLETTTANELLVNNNLLHKFEELVKLTSSTTPAITKVYAQQLALTAGAATVNLTALTDGLGAAMTMVGLKVQFVAFANKPVSGAANTDTLNVKIGGTDGYAIFGDAASEITLAIGGWCVFYNPEGCPDVATDVDQIDVSSSDTDADFIVMIAAG